MKRIPESLPFILTITVLGLTGCSARQTTQQVSFPFTGKTLSVVNGNDNMPLSISPSASVNQVTVKVQTQTKGKRAGVPAWSLSDGVLNVGTPCDTGFIGYCEGRYSVEVPRGTKVLVNGQPRAGE